MPETDARAQAIGEVERRLEQAWADHGRVPDALRLQIGIAVGEIAANIVEHSGVGRVVKISMEIYVEPDHVRIEFTDDGPPVAVDLDAVTMPHDLAERGRGLALAQSVLEHLSYRRTTLNHWTLVSHRF